MTEVIYHNEVCQIHLALSWQNGGGLAMMRGSSCALARYVYPHYDSSYMS
jgi:hypothetical protein